jgi:hypothetical protein
MLEAWSQYVRGISEKMTAREKEKLKHEILSKAQQVAEASGGVRGWAPSRRRRNRYWRKWKKRLRDDGADRVDRNVYRMI